MQAREMWYAPPPKKEKKIAKIRHSEIAVEVMFAATTRSEANVQWVLALLCNVHTTASL